MLRGLADMLDYKDEEAVDGGMRREDEGKFFNEDREGQGRKIGMINSDDKHRWSGGREWR